MAGYLKDEIEKIISNQNKVWLIETDELRNFKLYFLLYNASTLEYLNSKKIQGPYLIEMDRGGK